MDLAANFRVITIVNASEMYLSLMSIFIVLSHIFLFYICAI